MCPTAGLCFLNERKICCTCRDLFCVPFIELFTGTRAAVALQKSLGSHIFILAAPDKPISRRTCSSPVRPLSTAPAPHGLPKPLLTRASCFQADVSTSCAGKLSIRRDAQSQRIELQKSSHDGEPYTETLRQNPEGLLCFLLGHRLNSRQRSQKGTRTPARSLGTIVTSLSKVS